MMAARRGRACANSVCSRANSVDLKNAMKNARMIQPRLYSRAVSDFHVPNAGHRQGDLKMDVQKVDSTDDGQAGQWFDNEPRQFVLRGDAECNSLLESLDGLGVADFRCFMRVRADDGANVFTTIPAFKRRTRISERRLQEVKQFAWRLGNMIAESVAESLSGTSADGYDLLVEASVIVSNPDGPRGICTWATVISACDSDFDDREIELL